MRDTDGNTTVYNIANSQKVTATATLEDAKLWQVIQLIYDLTPDFNSAEAKVA